MTITRVGAILSAAHAVVAAPLARSSGGPGVYPWDIYRSNYTVEY